MSKTIIFENKISTMTLAAISLLFLNSTGSMAMEDKEEEIKNHVKSAYGTIAKNKKPCFSCSSSGGDKEEKPTQKEYSINLGYTEKDLEESPIESELGLGCGNPVAISSIKEGEIVIDLGSGGGFDCFLASKKVGKFGKVIGVDMTPDMIELAKKNSLKGDYGNVEFLLGEIEKLPLGDSFADVIISNCVVNLSPNKEAVFKEASRVLKIGGRLAISDIVTTTELPESIKSNIELYTGWGSVRQAVIRYKVTCCLRNTLDIFSLI